MTQAEGGRETLPAAFGLFNREGDGHMARNQIPPSVIGFFVVAGVILAAVAAAIATSLAG